MRKAWVGRTAVQQLQQDDKEQQQAQREGGAEQRSGGRAQTVPCERMSDSCARAAEAVDDVELLASLELLLATPPHQVKSARELPLTGSSSFALTPGAEVCSASLLTTPGQWTPCSPSQELLRTPGSSCWLTPPGTPRAHIDFGSLFDSEDGSQCGSPLPGSPSTQRSSSPAAWHEVCSAQSRQAEGTVAGRKASRSVGEPAAPGAGSRGRDASPPGSRKPRPPLKRKSMTEPLSMRANRFT